MIYLFHGEEEFEKREAIAALKAKVSSDPSLIDLNVTVLDGRSVTADEIRHHTDVPPFLGDYRMVVVNGLLGRGAPSKGDEGDAVVIASPLETWLIGYLPHVPDSTMLVLVESRALASKHRVVMAVADLGAAGVVRRFSAPDGRKGEVAAWAERRMEVKGARLAPGVAADLAAYIGADLRLIDSELEKLAIYAADRPVTQEDVRLLVPYAQDANIFAMLDALGNRQTPQAMRLLAHLYSDGAHPLYVLTMIVRHFRILLLVKALVGLGQGQDAIIERLKGFKLTVQPFALGKAVGQSQRYSVQQLMSIYGRLLDTDSAIKTGRIEAELALYLLVMELARS